MSDRGSFVTEYMYCDKCFEAMKQVLLDKDADSHHRIKAYLAGPGIIAGYISNVSPCGELLTMQYNVFNENNAPCHPVRIAILPEQPEASTILLVSPEGHVEDVGNARKWNWED